MAQRADGHARPPGQLGTGRARRAPQRPQVPAEAHGSARCLPPPGRPREHIFSCNTLGPLWHVKGDTNAAGRREAPADHPQDGCESAKESPMRRFFRRLANDLRRPARPVSARPSLECLEDRIVLTTWPVTKTIDDATVSGTLRYAVAHAMSGDTIQLVSNQLNGPINLSGKELLLNKNLTISASDATLKATISGQQLSRVFEVASGVTVSLNNLIITGGNADISWNGGGIYNWGTLTLSGCTLSGNSAYSFGGGIYNEGTGTLTLSSSTLSGNSADFGGGIYNHFGKVTDSGSTLSGNTATDDGGGLYDSAGTVQLTWTLLSGNKANRGGGAFESAGKLTVYAGNLHDNTAGLDGGGLYNDQGWVSVQALVLPIFSTFLVFRSSLATNHADSGHGGGIYNADAYMTVSNTDLSGNSAMYGGGIYNVGFNDWYNLHYYVQYSLWLSGCTLSGNTAAVGGGIYNTSDSNGIGTVDVSGSSLTGNTATHNGGGIYNSGSLTVANKSTVSGNSAGWGADLYEVMSAGASVWITPDSTVAVIYNA
jgi:predicted outer membrane repeat protein